MRHMKPTFRRLLVVADLAFTIWATYISIDILRNAEDVSWGWAAAPIAALLIPAVLTGSWKAVLGAQIGLCGATWALASGVWDDLLVGYAVMCLLTAVSVVFSWVSVFRRIRNASKPKLIALSGYARAGKDTAAAGLIEKGWVRVSFADKIRSLAYDVNPWVNTNGAQMIRLADLVDGIGWEAAKDHTDVRGFLQQLGTRCREHIDTNVWVNATLANLPADKNVVITDARFPNEVAAVEALRGATIRVTRPGVTAVNGHISETAVDNHEFTFVLRNDGAPQELADQVSTISDALRGRRSVSPVRA